MKREILTFSNKFSKKLPKPERKFMADMNYGMLASNSCLLTDIVDQLHERSQKINSVDRLSRHLSKGTPKDALNAYLDNIKKWCPAHPVIHIDDSDVVKPNGYKFESLGRVRDGSESTAAKNVYKKGIMSQKPLYLPTAIIRSVFFQKYILQRKKALHPSMTLLFLPWSVQLHDLIKQPLSWAGAMTITRCSSNWTPWTRNMSSA